jgi:hypothetical protein
MEKAVNPLFEALSQKSTEQIKNKEDNDTET